MKREEKEDTVHELSSTAACTEQDTVTRLGSPGEEESPYSLPHSPSEWDSQHTQILTAAESRPTPTPHVHPPCPSPKAPSREPRVTISTPTPARHRGKQASAPDQLPDHWLNTFSRPLLHTSLLGRSTAPNRRARRRQAQTALRLGRAVAKKVEALPKSLRAALDSPNPAHSLRHHHREWRRFIGQPVVRRWITRGYPLPVKDVPRKFLAQPPPRRDNESQETASERAQAMDAEVAKLLQTGAIRGVDKADLTLSSPIFVVPKKEKGKWRLIHDLRQLNVLIKAVVRFKLPGLKDLKDVASPGDWMCSWDLKSGYHQMSIDPKDHHLLGFQWRGKYFCFTVLPFGLKTAPYVFQRTMLTFAGILRRKGIRLIVYLDDFLLLASSKVKAAAQFAHARRLMARLGLVAAENKGQATPSQRAAFLGFLVDLSLASGGVIALTEDRLNKLKKTASALGTAAARARRIPTHRLQSQLGFLASIRPAVPLVGFFLSRAFASLRGAPQRRARRQRTKVSLDPKVHLEMKALCNWVHHNTSTHIWRPTTAQGTIETDASDSGWGAALHIPGEPVRMAKGTWTAEQRMFHITSQEALGLKLGLASLIRFAKGRALQCKLDATAVIGALLRNRSRSPRMCQILMDVHRCLLKAGASLSSIVYIPSKEHVLPDLLSRMSERNAWQLRGEVFRHCCIALKVEPEIDRFADSSNALLRRFNSWMHDPDAEAIDALAQDWRGTVSWANPPWPLLGRTIALIVKQHAPTLLVLPLWKTAAWWPVLLPHIRESLFFPPGSDLFAPQSTAYQTRVGPTRWPLLVVRLFA